MLTSGDHLLLVLHGDGLARVLTRVPPQDLTQAEREMLRELEREIHIVLRIES